MKHAKTRDKIVAENGFLCFEVEAASVMNYFPRLLIHGCVDPGPVPYQANLDLSCCWEIQCGEGCTLEAAE